MPPLIHGDTRRGQKPAFEYRVWAGIVTRCCNPNSTAYPRYGAKGIKMCERWRKSYANFLADMGRAPSEKHSIDRYPNRDGHYEPGNCRWATATQQSRNTSHARQITFNGKTMCISEWAEHLGISKKILTGRLNKLKWTVERALTTPAMLNRGPKKWRRK